MAATRNGQFAVTSASLLVGSFQDDGLLLGGELCEINPGQGLVYFVNLGLGRFYRFVWGGNLGASFYRGQKLGDPLLGSLLAAVAYLPVLLLAVGIGYDNGGDAPDLILLGELFVLGNLLWALLGFVSGIIELEQDKFRGDLLLEDIRCQHILMERLTGRAPV